MCNNSVNTSFEKYSFILPTLAIISILFSSLFPSCEAIAEMNKNTNKGISQTQTIADALNNSLKSMILIQKNSVLSQNDHETKITKRIKIKKVPVTKSQERIATVERAPAPAVKSQERTATVKGATAPTANSQKTRRVLATAYSSTVDQCDSTPFITASGTHVHDGTIAANFLKFGTKVKFPALYGDKIFTVEDRMKSNYKVDLWFPTRQEAINFGARWVEMEIL